jgi:hypothetical protein
MLDLRERRGDGTRCLIDVMANRITVAATLFGNPGLNRCEIVKQGVLFRHAVSPLRRSPRFL